MNDETEKKRNERSYTPPKYGIYFTCDKYGGKGWMVGLIYLDDCSMLFLSDISTVGIK